MGLFTLGASRIASLGTTTRGARDDASHTDVSSDATRDVVRRAPSMRNPRCIIPASLLNSLRTASQVTTQHSSRVQGRSYKTHPVWKTQDASCVASLSSYTCAVSHTAWSGVPLRSARRAQCEPGASLGPEQPEGTDRSKRSVIAIMIDSVTMEATSATRGTLHSHTGLFRLTCCGLKH